MTAEAPTIAETVAQIHDALREYIEAGYHIGHPALIARRRALLDREGVLFREPFIESTPRYQTGDGFAALGLEARRELDIGELRERQRMVLPLLAGVGGAAAASSVV